MGRYHGWACTTFAPSIFEITGGYLKGRINNVTEILEENGFVIIELDLGRWMDLALPI